MSVERNKALIRRLYDDVWNGGQLDVADDICAVDLIYRDPVGPNMRGVEALKELVTDFRRAFPDGRFIVEEQIGEGDKVVTRFRFLGTNENAAPRIGIAASGKRVEFAGTSTYRIADDRIAEAVTHRERIDLKLGAKVVLP
jgi:predicted ester cyclase